MPRLACEGRSASFHGCAHLRRRRPTVKGSDIATRSAQGARPVPCPSTDLQQRPGRQELANRSAVSTLSLLVQGSEKTGCRKCQALDPMLTSVEHDFATLAR